MRYCLIFAILASFALAEPQRIVVITAYSAAIDTGPVDRLIAEGWRVKAVAGGAHCFIFVMQLPDDAVERAKRDAEAVVREKQKAFEKRREQYQKSKDR